MKVITFTLKSSPGSEKNIPQMIEIRDEEETEG